MKNRVGKIGSVVTVLSVAAFALCMLIPFDFGSYFASMFIAFGYVMMVAAFDLECREDRKSAGKLASLFAGVYLTMILLVYFTQCTTVANEELSDTAMRILDYRYMGLLFNLDLLGYGIMALSTFFIGLTIEGDSRQDKALKMLLQVHGIFFTGCFILPMAGIFVNPDGTASAGGIAALECWCLYFLPIGILSFLHFKQNK